MVHPPHKRGSTGPHKATPGGSAAPGVPDVPLSHARPHCRTPLHQASAIAAARSPRSRAKGARTCRARSPKVWKHSLRSLPFVRSHASQASLRAGKGPKPWHFFARQKVPAPCRPPQRHLLSAGLRARPHLTSFMVMCAFWGPPGSWKMLQSWHASPSPPPPPPPPAPRPGRLPTNARAATVLPLPLALHSRSPRPEGCKRPRAPACAPEAQSAAAAAMSRLGQGEGCCWAERAFGASGCVHVWMGVGPEGRTPHGGGADARSIHGAQRDALGLAAIDLFCSALPFFSTRLVCWAQRSSGLVAPARLTTATPQHRCTQP